MKNDKCKRVEEVNHPERYNHSKYECIDIIEDLDLNFNLGSCLKYLWRKGFKNSEINELEKARWYLDREIQRLKKLENAQSKRSS